MTADTFTNDGVGVMLMGTGNDNNVWGTNQNANVFQVLADAIANVLTEAVTGGTLDLSGTPPPNASSQTRHAAIAFTGVLASNQIFIVPNLNKWWLVKNGTSGAFTLVFKTTAGSASSVIPQNSGWQLVQCDGANNIVVHPYNTIAQLMPDGTAGAPAYSWASERNSGWRRAGTQDYRLVINGADVLQVTGAGAGSPSIVNVLSPEALQIAGVAVSSSSFPTGTLMLFQQTSAPTGWTKQVTHDDKALRVVSGTVSSGGSSPFSTVFGKTATDAHTLTTAEMPVHNHNISDPQHSHSSINSFLQGGGGTLASGAGSSIFTAVTTTANSTGITIVNAGSGGSHTHPMDIRVNYVDLIIASKI